MGGALTAVVVPVLAGPARGRAAGHDQVLVSALLGATPGCPRPAMVALGARMLIVFAPQVLLYGLAVARTGGGDLRAVVRR